MWLERGGGANVISNVINPNQDGKHMSTLQVFIQEKRISTFLAKYQLHQGINGIGRKLYII